MARFFKPKPFKEGFLGPIYPNNYPRNLGVYPNNLRVPLLSVSPRKMYLAKKV